ncbi:hypothetical protein [Caenibacillus caldisaponilyticus]|uniref:hypothetical protein n=1 Tax=Caenibacillus caldisaponilyticus TaxID=1674942 RepID=UPI001300E7F0|nr:hypothetical protein [Caenibacillus caldisaponilyticus]
MIVKIKWKMVKILKPYVALNLMKEALKRKYEPAVVEKAMSAHFQNGRKRGRREE